MRRLPLLLLLAFRLAHAKPPPEISDEERREEKREGAMREPDPEKVSVPGVVARRAGAAHVEATRWPHLMPGAQLAHAADQSWIPLGPTDEDSDEVYAEVDSGRPTAIAVDPRDANVVYVATAGGGVWKTYNFVTAEPDPDWMPITETAGNQAIGALAIDPSNPDVVYVGFGDWFYVTGHALIKSTDGGATWSAPIVLHATYPGGGLDADPQAVRDIVVDPTNAQVVLVSTDVGLFRSMDGGATYALVDLPNASTAVAEGVWKVLYLGGTGASSTWLASGVPACAKGWLPPWPGLGVAAGDTSVMDNVNGSRCTLGNPGDMWRSTDAGKTWVSVRTALPSDDVGRMSIAAGGTANPATTVVYAIAGDQRGEQQTLGIWRSKDGGRTWSDATGAGTVANPTTDDVCTDMNLGHVQTWYDQVIAVNPANPNQVIAGGNICGVRTMNGLATTPTWENVSHWIPGAGIGGTADGVLSYVHADWQVALVSRVGGQTRVFAGTDGGVFSSTNVFTVSSGTLANWGFHNRGIVTHLAYSVGSGDPATGNPFTLLTGLQDNGTRYRDSRNRPTVFDTVIGGDGFGTAVNKGTAGEFVWGSVYSDESHYFCRPDVTDCTIRNNWNGSDPPLADGDDFPFVIPYTPVQTDPTGAMVLTISNQGVWRSSASGAWTRIGTFPNTVTVRSVSASPTKANVYAVGLSGGKAAVTVNAANWTTSQGAIGSGNVVLKSVSSVALTPNPPAGQEAHVYVVGSEAEGLDNRDPVPDEIGHIFLTTNKGASFVPIHGTGLPNVPVNVVRFDPTDMTNKTIFAGTTLGLYVTRDLGVTWSRFGYGLPMVSVTDLFIARNRALLRIATFGRGIWEIYPTAGTAKGVDGSGDFDQNNQLDWADLGALASRLGTNPSTNVWPTYSWICDVTGAALNPVNAIDDADLGAFLGRFGGQP